MEHVKRNGIFYSDSYESLLQNGLLSPALWTTEECVSALILGRGKVILRLLLISKAENPVRLFVLLSHFSVMCIKLAVKLILYINFCASFCKKMFRIQSLHRSNSQAIGFLKILRRKASPTKASKTHHLGPSGCLLEGIFWNITPEKITALISLFYSEIKAPSSISLHFWLSS